MSDTGIEEKVGIEKYDEIDAFLTSVDTKSKATQKSYKTQYNKLKNALGKDIGKSSQNKILDVAREENNANSKQALLNIGILVRRIYTLAIDKLEKERETTKFQIIEQVKIKNTKLQEELPSLNEINEYTEYLFKNAKWFEYIINYLLINYQTRNKDLDFDIVDLKRDTKDEDKNYIWIDRDRIVFIRNNYKTAKKYGRQVDYITDPDFVTAIKRMKGIRKGKPFIPSSDQLGYYIKKATLNGLGEGNYFKIIVGENREDVQELKKMGASRGTNLNTVATYYDTSVVPEEYIKPNSFIDLD